MYRARVMPCLLLKGAGLVKTYRFSKPVYVGDPINAVRIFNEKEVDELVVLDISATIEGREPAFEMLEEIAGECFMPLAWGGGIKRMDQIERVFKLGAEKVCINTAAVENPGLIRQAASAFGSQSIVVSLDVKRTMLGKYRVYTRGGRQKTHLDAVGFAQQMEESGAGEIFLTAIDRDGTMQGYDLELTRLVAEAVSIPVIACGGAGTLLDFSAVVRQARASAAAAGSLFVFHGRHRAVLISFPPQVELEKTLM